MSKKPLSKKNNYSPVIISAILVGALILFIFTIGPAEKDTHDIIKSSPTTISSTTLSNEVAPEQTKLADGSVKVITRKPLSLGLIVPANATYEMVTDDKAAQDWGIDITLVSGTELATCVGCQAFIQGCDGMNYESCNATPKFFGNIPVTEYTFKKDTQKVAGYMINRPGDPIFRVSTKNNISLSHSDKEILFQTLSTMQRYSEDKTITLF